MSRYIVKAMNLEMPKRLIIWDEVLVRFHELCFPCSARGSV